MTSLFQVLAHDDSERRLSAHKAAILSKTRVEHEYGQFIAAHGESALDYLDGQIAATVHIACAEVGHADPAGVLADIVKSYRWDKNDHRTAAIHESRKPKMCPFHKDVVDISLAQGDPKAGFESLRDHWGGERHCEGGGYEGDKCKFKPQMTTQSYWDERAEKSEQKRQERAEQAELEATQPVDDITPAEDAVAESVEPDTSVTEEISEPVAETTDDNVVHVDFQQTEVEAPAEGTEVPMSMAASTKVADSGPVPKMDKRKWTPQTVPALEGVDDTDGPHPTRRKDIIEPIKPDNASELSEIGSQVTERQDVTKNSPDEVGVGGTWSGGGKSAVSSHDPHKNELVEIMQSEFDGLIPQHEIDRAVVAHRNR